MPAAVRFLIDAVLVVAFAAVGRLSHDESLTPAGIADTAWPFLVGLGIGWAIVAITRHRVPVSVADGVPVWISTGAGGMLLRWLVGDGTALAFVIVATIMLGTLLLGWRAVAARRARRVSAEPASSGTGNYP